MRQIKALTKGDKAHPKALVYFSPQLLESPITILKNQKEFD